MYTYKLFLVCVYSIFLVYMYKAFLLCIHKVYTQEEYYTWDFARTHTHTHTHTQFCSPFSPFLFSDVESWHTLKLLS